MAGQPDTRTHMIVIHAMEAQELILNQRQATLQAEIQKIEGDKKQLHERRKAEAQRYSDALNKRPAATGSRTNLIDLTAVKNPEAKLVTTVGAHETFQIAPDSSRAAQISDRSTLSKQTENHSAIKSVRNPDGVPFDRRSSNAAHKDHSSSIAAANSRTGGESQAGCSTINDYPCINEEYPTIVLDTASNRYLELECFICHANYSEGTRCLFKGVRGIIHHMGRLHRHHPDREGIRIDDLVKKCQRAAVSVEQAQAISDGVPNAYIIEKDSARGTAANEVHQKRPPALNNGADDLTVLQQQNGRPSKIVILKVPSLLVGLHDRGASSNQVHDVMDEGDDDNITLMHRSLPAGSHHRATRRKLVHDEEETSDDEPILFKRSCPDAACHQQAETRSYPANSPWSSM